MSVASHSPAPNVVVFDLMRVLVNFSFEPVLIHVAKRSTGNIGMEAVRGKILTKEGVLNPYDRGDLSTEEFFRKIQSLGYQGSQEEFLSVWNGIFSDIPRHQQLARQISAQRPIALVSNINPAHDQTIRERFPHVYQLFDPKRLFLSHEIGMIKPDRAIFEHVEKQLGAKGPDILFVDDTEKNVEAAAQLGWRTIHLKPEVDLQAALSAHNVLPANNAAARRPHTLIEPFPVGYNGPTTRPAAYNKGPQGALNPKR
jgi:putative hydrolase of the HAD superfamily